ncbi:MAG: hypothetical protein AAF539_11725, partial [Planctomycetota bacterium]
DSFSFSGESFATVKWGFLAGSLGAFGALCLTTAMMTSRGNALLVMPIVFGGAVSVTAIVSMIKLSGHGDLNISPLLWVGMALTIIGVVLVANNTPHVHAAKPASPAEPTAAVNHAETVAVFETQAANEDAPAEETTSAT